MNFVTYEPAGGQSSLADYCAYYVAYSDGSCIDTNSARAPDRMLGEIRGRDSRYCLSLFEPKRVLLGWIMKLVPCQYTSGVAW